MSRLLPPIYGNIHFNSQSYGVFLLTIEALNTLIFFGKPYKTYKGMFRFRQWVILQGTISDHQVNTVKTSLLMNQDFSMLG